MITMMIDLLVKPAGIRCRQMQRPTKLHQIIKSHPTYSLCWHNADPINQLH